MLYMVLLPRSWQVRIPTRTRLYQIPAERVVPLWERLSEGGFVLVTFHHTRKLTSAEWCREATRGSLAKAIQSLSAVRRARP